jgi:precorrin-3B C17-methyltransferase
VIVSGGDPGVFAMGASVCEAIEAGPESWRALDIVVIPGITAMLAVAARAGAPLGHDFCAISLSDNLKPWELIERRIEGAASAGFVVAFYNPVSRSRPWQLAKALRLLSRHLPGATPVIFGRAVGRSDETVIITTLAASGDVAADMATLIIVGSPETRLIGREGKSPLVYTPRAVESISA